MLPDDLKSLNFVHRPIALTSRTLSAFRSQIASYGVRLNVRYIVTPKGN